MSVLTYLAVWRRISAGIHGLEKAAAVHARFLAGNSQSPYGADRGTAIYEITNKDHLPLWMPKNAFDLGIVELVQQSMQSVSLTMNVTNEIVSLDSH